VKNRRLALLVAMCLTTIASAHARDIEKVNLACPDRPLRVADINLAAKAAHWNLSPVQSVRLLEHARSVCAVGLTTVALLAPELHDADLASSAH
jgi:hypothetical protein